MPLASSIMDSAAALLNDASRTIFSYSIQLPFLNLAWNELQMKLDENGIPTSKEISTVITVAAGSNTFSLPSDFISPINLEERRAGSTDLFVPVTRVDDIPEMDPAQTILYWNWREEVIYVNPPTENREVRLTYRKSLNPLNDQNSNLNVTGSLPYLAYKTAALCARFIGENPERANYLESIANYHLQILLNLGIRDLQSTPKRPRPYNYLRREV